MSHEHLKERALAAASRAFGRDWHHDGWSIAPGRIELIGNHTDYNGGPVLAAGIDRVMVMATGPAIVPDSITLVAADLGGKTPTIPAEIPHDWRADSHERGPIVYVKGVLASLRTRDIPVRQGITLVATGDIPPGFGMSSSAAFCLATIFSLTSVQISPRDMIAIAREAEHRVGAMVGAMDQSASLAGGVICFDGRDSSYQHIQPDLGEYVFAVADSGVNRSLRRSSYGDRVRECEQARSMLERELSINLPNLSSIADHWPDVSNDAERVLTPVLFRRVRHIATETLRVCSAEVAVQNSDWTSFGRLMNESGESSANDYDISHPDVETLVGLLRGQQGVLGARMMGGGEGGPALALLHRDAVDTVRASLEPYFVKRPRIEASRAFYVCAFGPGAHREPA